MTCGVGVGMVVWSGMGMHGSAAAIKIQYIYNVDISYIDYIDNIVIT
jgi:hypothetical protein